MKAALPDRRRRHPLGGATEGDLVVHEARDLVGVAGLPRGAHSLDDLDIQAVDLRHLRSGVIGSCVVSVTGAGSRPAPHAARPIAELPPAIRNIRRVISWTCSAVMDLAPVRDAGPRLKLVVDAGHASGGSLAVLKGERGRRANPSVGDGSHPDEAELLHAVVVSRLPDVHVALSVDRERVDDHELPSSASAAAERPHRFQRLAPEDPDLLVRAVADVEKLLLRVWRQADGVDPRQIPARRDHRFLDECAVLLEHLNPVVLAVAYIQQAVTAHHHAVHRGKLLRDDVGIVGTFDRGATLRSVDRWLAVGAPMALVRARVGVEHDHPPVSVPVRHEHLVGLDIDDDAGGTREVHRVVARRRLLLADPHEKRSVPGEFHELRGITLVSTQTFSLPSTKRPCSYSGQATSGYGPHT